MIMSLFLYNFDIEFNVRIWDYLIARGLIRGIPEIITAIVCENSEILKCGSFEDYGLLFSA